MTDDPQRTFEEQATRCNPVHFMLAAYDDVASPNDDKDADVTATLPIPEGRTLAQHLAASGAWPARWRVRLRAMGSAPAARMRLDRLAKQGPVVCMADVTAEHVAAVRNDDEGAAEQAARPAPRRAIPRESPRSNAPEESPSVRAAREAAEQQRHANALLEEELRAKQLRRRMLELDAPTGGAAPATSPLASIAAIVAPLVPVVAGVIKSFLETQRQQTEALQAIVARPPAELAPMGVGQAPAGGLTLDSLVTLIPQLRALRKLVGLAGGDDDDGGEERPRSELAGMLETVKDLLAAARAPAPEPPAEVPPSRLPQVNGQAARPRRTPEDVMQARVSSFLAAVLREQQATADPATTAEAMFGQLGTLPEQFRALLVQSANVEQLLQGLPVWLPLAARMIAPAAIRNDPAKVAWLEQFLATIRELAGVGAQREQ